MGQDSFGELGGGEASDGWGGGKPSDCRLGAGCGEPCESFAVVETLAEGFADGLGGCVADDEASGIFEVPQEVFGLLFGAIGFGKAGAGINGWRHVWATLVLEGYQEL